MALPQYNNSFTDPNQEDYRRTKKSSEQSSASSMSSPKPDKASKQRDPNQQDAIRRRISKRRNLSEDPYQLKAQGG